MKVTSKVVRKIELSPEEKDILMKAGQLLEDIISAVPDDDEVLYDAASQARSELDYFMDKLEEREKGD